MGSDEIKTTGGRAVGHWNGNSVQDLQRELVRIKTELNHANTGEKLAPGGMPHAEQIPSDLRKFTAYAIWGCDIAEYCLCGANANRIVSVKDVRQFSLIDHH